MASKMVTKIAPPPKRLINAVVVSAGLMQKTVKVRVGARKFNNLVHKYFNRDKHYLVHDPNSSLRAGDIIEISPGWHVAKHVRHVVTRILAPFGSRIEERPPVPSVEERMERYWVRKVIKDARRRAVREGVVDEKGMPVLRLLDGRKFVVEEVYGEEEEEGERLGMDKPRLWLEDGVEVVVGADGEVTVGGEVVGWKFEKSKIGSEVD